MPVVVQDLVQERVQVEMVLKTLVDVAAVLRIKVMMIMVVQVVPVSFSSHIPLDK